MDPELAGRVPDLCQAFTARDFERVTGMPAEGAPQVPVALATVYSSCSYAGPSDHPTAVLTAYAEGEVDDVLDDGAGDGVGLEDSAWSSRTGLLIEIDDADWTLQVRVTNRRGRADRGLSLQVARMALGTI